MKLVVSIQKKLRDFTLNVQFETENEIFALLGASGCGKSMTLKCIAGIEKPDSGFISLNDRVLFDSENNINLPPQKRKIGYLFQNYALFPNMTIAENISFVISGNDNKKTSAVAELLQVFALTELEHAYPHQLSGGQQQRAALARIIAAESELLMLDEPFSALDNYLKWQLELELMKILKKYGNAALFVSHDRDEVYRLADKIAVLNKGKIDTINSKHQLFANPQTLAATLLTGCKNISKAHHVNEHTLYADDWKIELSSAAPVPHDLKYVGIRAHYLLPARDTDEINSYEMKVLQEIEDTFSYIVMVRYDDKAQPIRWEIDKKLWHTQKTETIFLTLPADKLILLTS